MTVKIAQTVGGPASARQGPGLYLLLTSGVGMLSAV